MTGTSRFRQLTDLAFTDPRFERVVGAMRAKIGRLEPLEMAEGGLGFNNLLYMAVLLAALADQPTDGSLRVLLVEEPEAHLHPQLQDLLMRFLGGGGRRRHAGDCHLALAELCLGGQGGALDGRGPRDRGGLPAPAARPTSG